MKVAWRRDTEPWSTADGQNCRRAKGQQLWTGSCGEEGLKLPGQSGTEKRKTKQLTLYSPVHEGLKNKEKRDELVENSSGLDSAQGLDQPVPAWKNRTMVSTWLSCRLYGFLLPMA